MADMYVTKRSLREEYRMQQREQTEGAPSLARKFPRLRGLRIRLEFFDAAGSARRGEMKCNPNLEHASSVVWFSCPGADCSCGDFNLSRALGEAVGQRRGGVTGELRCGGTRQRGKREPEVCGMLLRYRIRLDYN